MRLIIGSDHLGYPLKETLRAHLAQEGYECDDLGTYDSQPVDYPDVAAALAQDVADGKHDRGILICGTGIGMAIAANKVDGVRAAPVGDTETARLSREHNDLNVLTLGARVTPESRAREIVRAFLQTPFEGGRHQSRVDKIHAIEGA
jgi:ribose 5-phosphate isomerase B